MLSNSLIAEIYNDHFLTGTVYVALLTEGPSPFGSEDGVEVTGGSYARQAVSLVVTAGGFGGTDILTSTSALEFALPETTVQAAALCSAATGGTYLAYTDLSSPYQAADGDTLGVPAGDLTFGLT